MFTCANYMVNAYADRVNAVLLTLLWVCLHRQSRRLSALWPVYWTLFRVGLKKDLIGGECLFSMVVPNSYG